MRKYYVSDIVGARPGDARRWCDTAEEAIEARDNWRDDILAGVYDSEWEIEPEERQEIADSIEAYAVEYTRGGAIRSNKKI